MSIGYKDNLMSTILAKDRKCEFPINFECSPSQITLMPEMFSFNNERKYQTLIPLMKTSHLIDDDLKDKLNKCAFDFFSGKQANRTSDGTISRLTASGKTSPILPLQNINIVKAENTGNGKSDPYSSIKISKPTKTVIKLKSTKTNTAGQRTRHFCRICSTGFTTSGHLSRHNRIHTGEKIISVLMRAVDRGLVDMITVISIIELMQTRRKETGRGGRLAVDVSELSQKHLNIQITYK